MSVELLLPKTLDKKAYRLRARFKIEPYPTRDRLDREKVRVADMFVRDMHKQGWENAERYGFRLRGPFPMAAPSVIRPRRTLAARHMESGVAQGERFLDDGEDTATLVPALNATEWWEYEIAAVFSRTAILVEIPDRHEEEL